MVEEGNLEKVAGLLEFLGLRDVGFAWQGVAAGMVVEEDDPRRVAQEGLFDYPSVVDDGRCDGADCNHQLAERAVAIVQVQDPAFFVVKVVKVFTEEVCGRIGIADCCGELFL